ncbi:MULTISPECIES: NAD(+) diphosphatase [Clostridium]|uniref:NAD(+) diphosphatase n=3 Tax=Clostridium TaxID=1485 RepID=D8GIT8_CLOLD|nr:MULTISPECIES: NAD(+) diphosphatase [Clostridium]ADK15013.1 putative pyrophosphohydrolase [Clostridium ljungdahlii DSM 13528]AGY74265.1 NAD(+) diphosphatase [Clostridium autoethanogenum DSM 10061]ALU34456.1 NUDIX hydrolase [Clostridium autoethanogenum DSM 10061]OAA87674.1 NADH pyrophosphatase [Clostridium ljungdahlii DSM 13528]OAA95142.1 NADH pyrophosphatase [Clostridium coskatii]
MNNNFKISSDTLKKGKASDLCCVFHNQNLLVKKEGNTFVIPTFDDIKLLNIEYQTEFFLGSIEKKSCFAIESTSELNLPINFNLMDLYDLGSLLDEQSFLISGRASQILNWDKTHRFCGKCGSKTENKKDEMAKICPNCNHIMYPVICPAIIVAVTKGDKILLAHNNGFKDNMYGLIAGFVEAGEDLNSAVKREVFEEVGIKVKNIEYYRSSPWPFPNSLMIGFFAEYESDQIKVDGSEIKQADWFTKDNFPNIPKKFTIARSLINEFSKRNQ